MGWFVLGCFVGLFCGVLLWRAWTQRRRKYLAVVEFWVYSNAERLPPTPVLMEEVIAKNPHNRPGRPCVTQREGVLFTDLRFHVALAKREKNPHAFRPDLFEEHAEPDADVLTALAGATSIAKVRYASTVPLHDARHLQFTTHFAATLARLTRASLVYDTVAERFWRPSALDEELGADNNAERPSLHVRTSWSKSDQGCRAQTLGLRKVGRPELVSELQEHDQELIVCELLQATAERLFGDPQSGWPVDVTAYGDTFTVTGEGDEGDRTRVRLVRRIVRDSPSAPSV